MKYTIEQINEAWIKFNSPVFMVNKGKKLEDFDEEAIRLGIETENIKVVNIFKGHDFISYLIEYWNKKK